MILIGQTLLIIIIKKLKIKKNVEEKKALL